MKTFDHWVQDASMCCHVSTWWEHRPQSVLKTGGQSMGHKMYFMYLPMYWQISYFMVCENRG